ncbi:MAG: hypothetical protein KGK34_09970 [Chloroflexota bacterium]|nr:hypothetical protein [Chloroflexota bacterium]
MPKRSAKEDTNEVAFRIVQESTGQREKDPAAVALGRRGGLRGGPARAAKLTKRKLSAIGKKGAQARWGKKPPA